MKYLNLTKMMMFACMMFIVISCQEEEEIIADQQPVQKDNQVLANFTFDNGNTFKLIKVLEGEDPAVIAFESIKEKSDVGLDLDQNSDLDLYLALTPDNYPIPRVLIDLEESEGIKVNLPEGREVVENLESPAEFRLREIPENLLVRNIKNNSRTQGWCDQDDIHSDDFCQEGLEFTNTITIKRVYSDGRFKKIRNSILNRSSSDHNIKISVKYWNRVLKKWQTTGEAHNIAPGDGYGNMRYNGHAYRKRMVQCKVDVNEGDYSRYNLGVDFQKKK